jgi:outer membrane scaffolding protein for murein synthesis (MipA/OmpV family)
LTVRIAIIICCLIPFGSVFAQNEEMPSSQTDDKKPLWEVGVLASVFTTPHYVGSDEYYTFAVPFPYGVYRGEFFQADKGSVRGLFFHSDHIEFDISTGGNLPVSSDNNEARKDMEPLDALLEMGPAIRCYIYRRRAIDRLYIQAAWRGAVSFDFNGWLDIGADYRGYRATLDLKYKNESLFQDNDLTLFMSAGLSYADNTLNSYFYDVAPEFATPDRVQFDADAGYAGLHLTCAVLNDLSERWSIGGVAGWRNINGAVFEESPLVRTSDNYYGSVFLIWKFARSKVLLPDAKSQDQ